MWNKLLQSPPPLSTLKCWHVGHCSPIIFFFLPTPPWGQEDRVLIPLKYLYFDYFSTLSNPTQDQLNNSETALPPIFVENMKSPPPSYYVYCSVVNSTSPNHPCYSSTFCIFYALSLYRTQLDLFLVAVRSCKPLGVVNKRRARW